MSMSRSALRLPAQPAMPRRHLLQWGLLGCAAVLAGCGSKPRSSRTGRGGAARTRAPDMTPPSVKPLGLPPSAREAALARAMLVVNTPYTYGGNTPEGGFDCSGLVQYVLRAEGLSGLPRSTAQWAAASRPVSDAERQRGDLVFFNTTGAPFSHMGIYVGDGRFVHAPSSGGTVRLQRLSDAYFARRYTGTRTVFAAAP